MQGNREPSHGPPVKIIGHFWSQTERRHWQDSLGTRHWTISPGTQKAPASLPGAPLISSLHKFLQQGALGLMMVLFQPWTVTYASPSTPKAFSHCDTYCRAPRGSVTCRWVLQTFLLQCRYLSIPAMLGSCPFTHSVLYLALTE